MDPAIPTVALLNTPVCILPLEEVCELAVSYACKLERCYAVGLTDVHVLTRARHNERFRNAFHKFDLVCPDGMPLLWEINARVDQSRQLKYRVTGADLMEAVIHNGTQGDRLSHFLLGGTESLLGEVSRVFKEKFPTVKIASTYAPPYGEWSNEENLKIAELIKQSGANCVWVGLGSPKREQWIGENLHWLPNAVYFSVGAAFDFHAGRVKRAPLRIQNLGLEWLYRVLMEPRRLWKRYAKYILLYLYYRIKDQRSEN